MHLASEVLSIPLLRRFPSYSSKHRPRKKALMHRKPNQCCDKLGSVVLKPEIKGFFFFFKAKQERLGKAVEIIGWKCINSVSLYGIPLKCMVTNNPRDNFLLKK